MPAVAPQLVTLLWKVGNLNAAFVYQRWEMLLQPLAGNHTSFAWQYTTILNTFTLRIKPRNGIAQLIAPAQSCCEAMRNRITKS